MRVLNTLPARLATPFRWLMVAGIAYTLATSITYLLAGADVATPQAPVSTPQAGAARPTVDIDGLLARNLFGVAGERPATTQSTATTAVATQLPLELRGVFVAEGDGVSAAIIAERGKAGMLYAVGQNVAGSATLEDVAPDHVILRRAGVAETLQFPRAGQSMAPQPPPPPDMPYDAVQPDVAPYETIDEAPPVESGMVEPEPAAAATPEELVDTYREQLEENPDQALRSLGMSPVDSGAAAGYRVDDLAQSPYLSQTGLQPGDVILSVNGRPVGDLNQDRLELENVLAQGSARIEVQRGTRRFFVTASLP
jgi:general secretion pathway protein C